MTNRNDRSSLPTFIAPQLVRLVVRPPSGVWHWEIKFDGYRLLARIENGKVSLLTKKGHNWAARFPEITAELAGKDTQISWLDGELVRINSDGLPDFGLLQSAIGSRKQTGYVYYIFDLLFDAGEDLRNKPIEFRRSRLERWFDSKIMQQIKLSHIFDEPVTDLLESACSMKLEGLVGKRAKSLYTSSRDGSWVKMKCYNRQEFIIVGYRGNATTLILGWYSSDGTLNYAGRVSNGIPSKTSTSLFETLTNFRLPISRLANPPRYPATWVEPVLVCEIKFSEITRAGRLRHPVFIAIRADIDPEDVTIELSEM